ncbi:MAG: hypothetical protein DWQ30_04965 [Acidobacteria bacterium]|nr:MAG: hypothetical protein DWQ30_04965 [Acidobacteriota bacterium]
MSDRDRTRGLDGVNAGEGEATKVPEDGEARSLAPSGEVDAEQQLAALLREAGPRPEIPAAHLAQIRATTHGEWRRMLGAERSGSVSWLRWAAAAALLLAIAALATTLWPARDAGILAELALAEGVEVTRADGTRVERANALAGLALRRGDRLETVSGEGAALRLPGGESVRLRGGSTLRLGEEGLLELLGGAVYVDSPGSSAPGGIEVATFLGVVREIGTQFEVALPGVATPGVGLTVRVREGAVVFVPGATGVEAARAEAGERLVVAPDGAASVEADVASNDSSWQWVLEAAPPLSLEGRSVAEVLDAAARELGLDLLYASEAARRHAEAEVLSADPLVAAEALEVAAQASGLSATRQVGSLLIDLP